MKIRHDRNDNETWRVRMNRDEIESILARHLIEEVGFPSDIVGLSAEVALGDGFADVTLTLDRSCEVIQGMSGPVRDLLHRASIALADKGVSAQDPIRAAIIEALQR